MVSQIWEPGENGHGRCTSKVVEYVWTCIREGSLKIGDRLPSERAIAERLHVSRSSIRAGIAYLSAIGLVNVRPGLGGFISDTPAAFPLSGVDLICGTAAEDLVEARLLVESAIVRVAAARVAENDCAALAEEVTEMYASSDEASAFHLHDLRFDRAMARACGNPILAAMAETLLARASGEVEITRIGGRELKHLAELHRSIYRAIRMHRPDDAFGPLESCIRTWMHMRFVIE